MADSHDNVSWLQEWVRREFGEGPIKTANPWVQIETLDPGWSATISLTDTAMQDADFEEIEINRTESAWLGRRAVLATGVALLLWIVAASLVAFASIFVAIPDI